MGKTLGQVLKCLMFYLYTKRGKERYYLHLCFDSPENGISCSWKLLWFRNCSLQFSTPTKNAHTLLSLSCPPPSGPKRDKDHRLGLEQQWDMKMNNNSDNINNKRCKKRIDSHRKKHTIIDSGSFHPVFSNGKKSLFPGKDCLLPAPLAMTRCGIA